MTPSPVNRPMSLLEWLLLLALAVLWGGTFFFSEVALEEVRPFTLVLGRVAFAAAALLVVVYASGHRMPGDWSSWTPFLAMGALNNLIPFSLILWGQVEITSSLAAILNATTPLFAVLLAHVLTHDERITAARLAGVALGIGGVAVMLGPAALRGLGVHLLAQIAVLGAALSYAFAGIYGRRFKGQPPLVTAAGQVTATTVMMLPIALFVDRPWTGPVPGITTWGAILALALLGTALAYILYFRILATAGATNLLLVTFLIPVTAIVLGTLILGERLEAEQVMGMVLIALGLAAIDGRALRWLSGSKSSPSRDQRP